MLRLFEYAVVLQPKKNKDGDVVEEGKIVVPITTIVAKDQEQATLLASRSIPEEVILVLDRVSVVVRPF